MGRPTLKQRLGQYIIPRLPLSRFAFNILRWEFLAFRVRLAHCLWPGRWLRVRRLKRRDHLYVNVASGGFLLDGFEHLDLNPPNRKVLAWDCTRSLPFSDGSCEGIRAEHFFEHLDFRDQAREFLKECHRCLRPGGVLRIVVPDAGRYLAAYTANDPKMFQALSMYPYPDDLPSRMDVVSHVFHQDHEHRWGYDAENLRILMLAAGFKEAEQMEFGRSLDPKLGQDRTQHMPYSLYVDARK